MVENRSDDRPRSGPPPPAADPTTAGAVLIGGGSKRMGRDKAELVVDGQRLLVRAVRALQAALGSTAADILVVGPHRDASPRRDAGTERASPASPAGTRYLTDLRVDAGPLAGLEAALDGVTEPGVTEPGVTQPGVTTPSATDATVQLPTAAALLIVGVDHPFLAPGVLALLARRLLAAPPTTSAVVLGTADGPQPLIGAYRPTALRTVRRLLDAGERRLRSLGDHLDVEVLPQETWRELDPPGATAIDVDDPATLTDTIRWHRRVVATARRGDARTSGPQATPERTVLRVRGSAVETRVDALIGEEPLVIRAAGPDQEPVTLATTLRTPGHEAELAVGWVLAEGLATAHEVLAAESGDPIAPLPPVDTVTVRVRHTVDPNALVHRHVVATASCGVCGRATIEEVTAEVGPIDDDPFRGRPLAWARLTHLPGELRLAQSWYRSTGGIHAAGLFDAEGRLVTVREDVGRHNALDAAIGAHALAGMWPDTGDLSDLLCLLSGRVGVELVAKAAVARIPIVAAVGAASDLAVRIADRLQITLVGSLRDGDGTVYTHPGRLVLPGDADPGW